eukprot:TRINITY_DN1264_c0_g1_i2.p1 TRINITY_DN1264_c0_g1~~TRINITY_DN1264_c0_g1_i2.p1  ORF type:complete len:318 (+),score=60.65 TRINITY_DN1264_c0_g1_i2:164-1117(+)
MRRPAHMEDSTADENIAFMRPVIASEESDSSAQTTLSMGPTSSSIADDSHVQRPRKTSTGRTKRHTYNITVLGIGLCVLFSAFNTTQTLMTTVNKDVGYISLAVLYFTFACTNFFIAPALEHKFGPRAAIIFGAWCYVSLVAACIHPTPMTLVAASAVVGFGAGVLWTGQGHYLTLSSTPETSGFYSGLFWSIFQMNMIIGNILVGVLFSEGESNSSVFFILTLVACAGCLLLFLMANARSKLERKSGVDSFHRRVSDLVLSVWRFIQQTRTLLMIPWFCFNGALLSLESCLTILADDLSLISLPFFMRLAFCRPSC